MPVKNHNVKPGEYFWTTWNAHVQVFKKKGGRHLFVTPPGPHAVAVKVSHRLAGELVPVCIAV